MKRISTIIISLILILTICTPIFADNRPAYRLPDGRISVQEDVFNSLVTNDKLMEVYKEETEYLHKTIADLKILNEQGANIQEQRVAVLKDTIGLKDQVIVYKDENLLSLEKMYNIEHKKVNKFKTMSFIEKFLITGLTVYACSEIDNSSAQMAVGAIGTSIILLNW